MTLTVSDNFYSLKKESHWAVSALLLRIKCDIFTFPLENTYKSGQSSPC